MAYVLVVDDYEDIRASMRAILQDVRGHTVLEAPDGLTALTTLRASARLSCCSTC